MEINICKVPMFTYICTLFIPAIQLLLIIYSFAQTFLVFAQRPTKVLIYIFVKNH
nr:MAG TPA: hypothetical protein [Caudoviricetes sp.]